MIRAAYKVILLHPSNILIRAFFYSRGFRTRDLSDRVIYSNLSTKALTFVCECVGEINYQGQFNKQILLKETASNFWSCVQSAIFYFMEANFNNKLMRKFNSELGVFPPNVIDSIN